MFCWLRAIDTSGWAMPSMRLVPSRRKPAQLRRSRHTSCARVQRSDAGKARHLPIFRLASLHNDKASLRELSDQSQNIFPQLLQVNLVLIDQLLAGRLKIAIGL